MRTRTVAALLGAVVALGMGVDLAGGAGSLPQPALVRTDNTVPACVRASTVAELHGHRLRADPRRHRQCRRRPPSPGVPSGRAGRR
ncbi:hypothetical protein [Dactylosporangium sp. CA-139066]|uniref:hypothetical protein n=1 Tax=Dactylosporangium sp. CA-139066 TaxID=3239930 RepID=UPI003D949F78